MLALLVSIPLVYAQVCDDVYPHLSAGLKSSTSEACAQFGGCWDTNIKSCYMPKIFGYSYIEVTRDDTSFTGDLTLNEPCGAFGPDYDVLSVKFQQETESQMRLTIKPKDVERWEIPASLLQRPETKLNLTDSHMKYAIKEDPFQFGILRSDLQEMFYFSKMLVFQDQYIQFVLGTPKNVVATYGFGESTRHTQQVNVNESFSLWATDFGTSNFDKSLYGSHPFFVQLLDDGTAQGAFIVNSNALEVSTYHDDSKGNTIGFQMTGGIIDIYFFSGRSPQHVIQQYLAIVGTPMLVPYWSLGFHNCRWGYPNIDYVMDVVANYSAAGIPLETQWCDIDYMDKYKDFTVDPIKFPKDKMQSFIADLESNGQHFVPIVDPGIYANLDEANPYSALVEGLEKNVFIKDLTYEAPYLGQVWPGNTYFPDWFASNATEYWTNQLGAFHDLLAYSGIWIDMNEVSNFCNNDGNNQVCYKVDPSDCSSGCCGLACKVVDTENKYDNAPFVPHVSQGSLGGKTLPMSAVHEGGVVEYNAHSLYGYMESIATNAALTAITGKRPFVLSRSTFPGSGKVTAHWTGDNAATWDNLIASITAMTTLSLFGLSMTGADICGFNEDTTEELCARWIEVGAFSPFSRNHNSIDRASQELYRWESVAEASRNALELRYRLLSHLYTLMYQASVEGTVVMSGLWLQFPKDLKALAAQNQYMWADSILFTPVVEEGKVEVSGYFPEGLWYSLFDDSVITGLQTVVLSTPLTSTNVHVRGGVVLPFQDYASTTKGLQSSPYALIVALDAKLSAKGSLYLDDGISIDNESKRYSLVDYTCGSRETEFYFTSKVSQSGYVSASPVHSIEFWGVPQQFVSSGCTAKFAGVNTKVLSLKGSYSIESMKLKFGIPRNEIAASDDFTMHVTCN